MNSVEAGKAESLNDILETERLTRDHVKNSL